MDVRGEAVVVLEEEAVQRLTSMALERPNRRSVGSETLVSLKRDLR